MEPSEGASDRANAESCSVSVLGHVVDDAIDGTDGAAQDHGDIYCVVCFDNGNLEIFDIPNFNCVFSRFIVLILNLIPLVFFHSLYIQNN